MYENTTIIPLRGPDRIRKRPEVIFGSKGADGCKKMLFDLIDYSIQEFQLGNADHILIKKCHDGSYVIEDNGSGILIEPPSDTGLPGWEETFCGTFPKRSNSSEIIYALAAISDREEQLRSILKCDKYIPSHSIFAGTAASLYLNARVFRDGSEYTLRFQRGHLAKSVTKETRSGKKQGTRLHFLPDEDVFTSTRFDFVDIFEYASEQAALNPGLKFIVKDFSSIPAKENIFCYADGIKGLLIDKLKSPTISSSKVMRLCWKTVVNDGFEIRPLYLVCFEITYAYSPGRSLKRYFHNYKRLEHGGVLCSAVSESIDSVREHFSEKGIFVDTALDNISIFISTTSEWTNWSSERQVGIANKGIYNCLKPMLQQSLYKYFDQLAAAQLLE